MARGRGESRARSAVEHGYFDEAHMVNDACGLFGASQHALLRRPFSSKLGVAGCRPSDELTTGGGQEVDVMFIASVAVVAADPAKSRELYVDALGLPLKAGAEGEYFYSERIDGSKHFGVWPLAQAAQACFGVEEWPADRPVPQVSIEFEVADASAVAAAAEELKARGLELLHEAREEPWGQTVARLLSLEGSIVGISYAPSLHAAA